MRSLVALLAPALLIASAAHADFTDWQLRDGAQLDPNVTRQGAKSLRLEQGATLEGRSVSALREFDAAPWRGKIVELTAWLRGERFQGELYMILQARGPNASANRHSPLPLTPTSTWTRHRVLVDVPEEAGTLVILFSHRSPGSVWVDDAALSELDTARPPSAEVERWLDEAVAKAREAGYNAGRVNWESVRATARLFASGTRTPAEAQGAGAYIARSLEDGHSMFYPASALRAEREVDPRDEDFGIQDRRVGSVAYLGVPGFGGGSPARLRAYAQDLRGRIERQHRASPCGWIVDLRGNGGGNMHPMIAGLEPFLGHQTLGYTVERKSREAWSGLGYYERIGERRPERLEPDLTSAPVAVLVGSQTASSGEIVAIAFRGRAKARSYGTPTAGASSANLRVDLSDGSALFVTAALNADRTGKLIEGALVPDVRTAPADASPSTIPGAAIEWLESVGGCRR